MARGDYLKALIRAHSEGDTERFFTVALQLAAQEAKQGHTRFAKELRDLVDEGKGIARRRSTEQLVPPAKMAQPRGELVGLLDVDYPTTKLSHMVLEEQQREKIERILLEQIRRSELRGYGLQPIRRLLLVGPPGTGKTMTAAALAGELRLPLFTIRLDGLISKYLGETAAKLRLVFDAIQKSRGVYLFDEFDAIGTERVSRNDVGEIRRVVNSFLQFLESDVHDSLVIAATNHPQLLDRALFRRFDITIQYSLPSRVVVEKVMRTCLSMLDTSNLNWESVIQSASGLSHAEIVRACEDAAKIAILSGRNFVDTNEILRALDERHRLLNL